MDAFSRLIQVRLFLGGLFLTCKTARANGDAAHLIIEPVRMGLELRREDNFEKADVEFAWTPGFIGHGCWPVVRWKLSTCYAEDVVIGFR